MVTFVPAFITREGAEANAAAWEAVGRARAAHPEDREIGRVTMEEWFSTHPDPPASVSDVADHIDHVRDVAGIDHVGVGSDFDGSPSMPEGLEDVSGYPRLFTELAARGYADDDLSKIAGRNVLRVMRAAERTAERLQAERPAVHRDDRVARRALILTSPREGRSVSRAGRRGASACAASKRAGARPLPARDRRRRRPAVRTGGHVGPAR